MLKLRPIWVGIAATVVVAVVTLVFSLPANTAAPPPVIEEARREIIVAQADEALVALLQQHAQEYDLRQDGNLYADVSEALAKKIEAQGYALTSEQYILVQPLSPEPHSALQGFLQAYGSEGRDVTIPDNVDTWAHSDIRISGAPADATVSRFDCHAEIIHTYVGDLLIDVGNEQTTNWRVLRNQVGGSADNINQTWYSISGLPGEPVNQIWRLWVMDRASYDTGYIDSWWIKIYYEVEDATPQPTSANAGSLDCFLPAVLVAHNSNPGPTTPTPSRTPTASPTPMDAITTIYKNQVYVFEAENLDMTLPVHLETDASASGCTSVTGAWQNLGEPGDVRVGGYVDLVVNVQESGNYYLWARTRAETLGDSDSVYNHDSFWFQIDAGYAKQWQVNSNSHGQWGWMEINGIEYPGQPHPLGAGEHHLRIGARESSVKLDMLVLTSQSAFSPTDALTDPCSIGGSCSSGETLSVGATRSGTNNGGAHAIHYYNGSPWLESGPEKVYALYPQRNGRVSVALSGLQADLDIFVLADSCNGNNLLTYGDTSAEFSVQAGHVYYVSIDGYHGAVSSFTIQTAYAYIVPDQQPTATVTPSPTVGPAPVTTRELSSDSFTVYQPGEEQIFGLRNVEDDDPFDRKIAAVLLEPQTRTALVGMRMLSFDELPADGLSGREEVQIALFNSEKQRFAQWFQTIDVYSVRPDWVQVTFPEPVMVGPEPFYLTLSWPKPETARGGGIHVMGCVYAIHPGYSFYDVWSRDGFPSQQFQDEGKGVEGDWVVRAFVSP